MYLRKKAYANISFGSLSTTLIIASLITRDVLYIPNLNSVTQEMADTPIVYENQNG